LFLARSCPRASFPSSAAAETLSCVSRLGMDHLIGSSALKPYMHGYFVALKLYDAARVIANPYVYEEHRAKLVQEKLDKLSEGRIRTRRDQPRIKVNKALAEKVVRDEERDRMRRDRKGGETLDGEDGVKEKATLLNDSRFQALFEDPEFEVNQRSREFALLNPSTIAQRQNNRPGQGEEESDSDEDGLLPKGKTAVEDEQEESDKAHSESSDEEKEEIPSDDSSEAGGEPFSHIYYLSSLRHADLYPASYKAHQAARQQKRDPNVRLVPLRAQSSSKALYDKDATFGQRRSISTKCASTSPGAAAEANELVVRKVDGSVEMSWVPAPKSKGRRTSDTMDVDGEPPQRSRNGVKEDTRKGVERFGAGMEKGGEDPMDGRALSEQERSGRKKRRKDVRSGSKNTFRRL
jgi:ribosome biogenesis protein ENP2